MDIDSFDAVLKSVIVGDFSITNQVFNAKKMCFSVLWWLSYCPVSFPTKLIELCIMIRLSITKLYDFCLIQSQCAFHLSIFFSFVQHFFLKSTVYSHNSELQWNNKWWSACVKFWKTKVNEICLFCIGWEIVNWIFL